MPRLLSGSTLRRGGSGEFLDLKGAQPQLPPTPTTSTGYTVITNELLQTRYASSLGNIEVSQARMYSNLPEGVIRVAGSGSVYLSTSTTTGVMVVEGGVGVGGNMYIEEDIVVNGLTIGRGHEGVNNIVIRGVAEPQINDFANGQESIAIGYDALGGLTTSYKNIAIGRYALSSGTNILNSIAIGDSALREIGVLNEILVAGISGINFTDPIEIIAVNHGLSSGTYVVIKGVVGTTELNNQYYYVDKASDNSLYLYLDNILSQSVDGDGLSSYVTGGGVYRVLLKNNNIAIGVNAGRSLIDGEQNFFFGDGIAKNLTTGSYNFFIGHEVGNNMTYGNANIAIGGDNLIDGRDNQVNIGSVFYYNGIGNATINADTEIGSGTESTGTNTGALTVVGGVGVLNSVYVGGELYALTTATVTGEIYSPTVGNPDENNLVYTPKVTLADTPPASPRIGDFWIDTNLGIEFQYIQDDTNRIWVQFTSL